MAALNTFAIGPRTWSVKKSLYKCVPLTCGSRKKGIFTSCETEQQKHDRLHGNMPPKLMEVLVSDVTINKTLCKKKTHFSNVNGFKTTTHGQSAISPLKGLDHSYFKNCTKYALLHTLETQHLHCRNTKLEIRNPFLNGVHVPSACFSAQAIVDVSPKLLQPYLRLIRFDKPIGTWLLYWPCTWSIALAADAGHLPDFWLLTLFGAGAFFMRGAGCIINDMWDRDYDKKVARTKLRPLACGELSMFQGLMCLGGMLSASLAILLQLNWYSVALGASSMGLVILYPLAKRYTFWPQAMLGLTFNYGALLGWVAVQGSVDLSVVLPLYLACFSWTMVYDTIYAHQDKYDDMLIGVKSTALKFGDQTKYWLSGFSAVTISGLFTTGLMCEQTWPFYLGTAITSLHLLHQIWDVNLDDADDCARKFRSNTWLGAVMFIGIAMGTLMKPKKEDEENVKPENLNS